ncbi:MAG: N-acetylmuramoyl-L-alanine amidase, partial [Verrucomicrobia bacterium]|nr:N-acetylmuramoyl-L-alanine amidase [Verrucomicrobiota bacterium]
MTPRRLLPWLGLLIFTGSAIGLLNKMAVNQPIETPGLGPPPSTVVVLDAGHGGADTGAVALGLAEKDLTLDVVRRIESNLARRGIATRLTRTKDVYVPLAARTRFANSLPNAIFVSIHFNHANNAPA